MRHRRRILNILEAQDSKTGASTGAGCIENRHLGLGPSSSPAAFMDHSNDIASYYTAEHETRKHHPHLRHLASRSQNLQRKESERTYFSHMREVRTIAKRHHLHLPLIPSHHPTKAATSVHPDFMSHPRFTFTNNQTNLTSLTPYLDCVTVSLTTHNMCRYIISC